MKFIEHHCGYYKTIQAMTELSKLLTNYNPCGYTIHIAVCKLPGLSVINRCGIENVMKIFYF